MIKRFWETPDAVTYYQENNGTSDKILLPRDEYDSALKAVELIKVSPYVASYFVNHRATQQLLHQVPICFELEGAEFKALLDGIKIDHEERTIEPFDLKTIGKSIYEFPSNYINFGYYTQAALYDYAIRTPQSPVFNLIDEGYTVKDFIFIVVETKNSSTNPAVIYTTSQHERNCGLEGGFINGKYYKGVYQLLEDYLWHERTNEWTYPREVYKNAGRIPLSLFQQ